MNDEQFDVGFTPPPAHDKERVDPPLLDHLARFRLYEPGEEIFHQDERGSEAYIVKSGKIRISQTKGDATRVLGIINPGQVIGEMAVISDMARIATATAIEETVCVALSRLAMHRMMDSVDLETRTIIEFLVDHIRDTAEGAPVDQDEARRNRRILEILLENPNTQVKLALQEPFFQLLCNGLLERAK